MSALTEKMGVLFFYPVPENLRGGDALLTAYSRLRGCHIEP